MIEEFMIELIGKDIEKINELVNNICELLKTLDNTKSSEALSKGPQPQKEEEEKK